MLDKNNFTETLREVEKIINTSDTPLSREDILHYFEDSNLTKEQEEMVFDYLITSHDEEDKAHDVEEDAEKEPDTPPVNDDEEQYMPQSKTFQMYMEEIESIPKYTKEEKDAMYEKLFAGDESVIKEISNMWLPKVFGISKEYLSPKYSLEDVIQEGNMALFLIVGEMCGSVCNNIEQEIERAITTAMEEYISEVTGESDSENTIVGKAELVNDARKYLIEKDGFEPSVKEISEFTKIPEDELNDILMIIEKADKNVR